MMHGCAGGDGGAAAAGHHAAQQNPAELSCALVGFQGLTLVQLGSGLPTTVYN